MATIPRETSFSFASSRLAANARPATASTTDEAHLDVKQLGDTLAARFRPVASLAGDARPDGYARRRGRGRARKGCDRRRGRAAARAPGPRRAVGRCGVEPRV